MTDEEAALDWLRNYHGSIDSTALLLAYRAGARRARSEALEEAAKVAENPYSDAVGAVGGRLHGDEPNVVGVKIAAAVRARKGEGEGK